MDNIQETKLSRNLPLPEFKYHPDPLKNDVIEESDQCCVCCNQKRGYIYTGPVYAIEDLNGLICPWCIEDGSAAEKFDACFCDPLALYSEEISKSIIDEVARRTPGYHAWQEPDWLAHCQDACEYQGMATVSYLRGIKQEQKHHILETLNWDESAWDQLMNEVPKEDVVLDNPEVHIFLCRHCRKDFYNISYS